MHSVNTFKKYLHIQANIINDIDKYIDINRYVIYLYININMWPDATKGWKVPQNENCSYYQHKQVKGHPFTQYKWKKKSNSRSSFTSAGNTGIMLTWWKNAKIFMSVPWPHMNTRFNFRFNFQVVYFIFWETLGGGGLTTGISCFAWFLSRGRFKTKHSSNKNSSLSHSRHQIKIFPTWPTRNFRYHKISPAN